jgi:signal transduction histidine kinase
MQNGRSWFDVHITSFESGEGTRTGLTCVVRDVTGRKQSEEALHQVNKKLTLLTGITRHEIRSQLTVLQGFLNLLQEMQSDPSFREYFERASDATERISAMIRFTKEYEKIGVHAPTWYDIRALAGTEEIQAMLGQIQLKNDLPAGTDVLADSLISLVISNLVDNTVRHGERVSTIRVALHKLDGDRIITFEDDGVGIPPDEKEKIFAYGYGKNTGMGLFLAREILDITGISIRETGEPGKGARFEIMVPKGMWREGEVKTGGK